MSQPKIAIIAAMPGEIRPLVKGWERSTLRHDGRRFRVFRRARAFAVAGGMGSDPIRAATRAVVEHVHPDVIISAGWAGSLRPEIKMGQIVVPEIVIDAADGRAFRTFVGAGTLVTAAHVLNVEDKFHLATRYTAQAVDMEAAAVAEVAQETTTRFLAVRAVFDEQNFFMPPLDRFCSGRGSFRYGKFLAYLALRPGRWSTVAIMRRNAAASALAVCEFLDKLVACTSLVEIQQLIAKLALGVPL